MRTTYRYDLNLTEQILEMPIGARPILFGWQQARNTFSVWAEVDSDALTEERTFIIQATGTSLPDKAKHIGSAIMPDGFYVFHLYEI